MSQAQDQSFDISIPVNSDAPDNKLIYKHYFSSLGLYAIALFFFWHNSWYGEITRSGVNGVSVKQILLFLWLSYALIALPVYFYARPVSLWNSKPILIIGWFKKLFSLKPQQRQAWLLMQPDRFKMSYHEAQAFGVFFVKCFFGPLMLNFFVSALQPTWDLSQRTWWLFQAWYHDGQLNPALVAHLARFEINLPGIETIDYKLAPQALEIFTRMLHESSYLFSLKFLFMLDTMVFAFGYFWEAGFLNNRIRSVDITPLGLITCLCVYPPLNMVTNAVIQGVPNDLSQVPDLPQLTWTLRILAVSMVLIYVSASLSLWTKASNLTNRGTVSRGPYALVRHPAYASKLIFWLLTSIPFFFPSVAHPHFDIPNPWVNGFWMGCSLLFYATIYYLRSITEERHLAKDPDYRAYMNKVRYRFIPGIW